MTSRLIASQEAINREVIKRALFYGGVMGSFAVERFGTERLQSLTREEIDARFQIFPELTQLELSLSRSGAGAAKPPCVPCSPRAFRFVPSFSHAGAAKYSSLASP